MKEGILKRYKGFIKGYKKCSVRIRGFYLTIQKSERQKDSKLKIDLRDELIVEPYAKDLCEFIITYPSP